MSLYSIWVWKGEPFMKISFRCAFASALLMSSLGAAFAADLPARTPVYKAPPAPVWVWTGFYVGGNVGYGWGNGDTFFNPLPTAAGFVDLAPTTLSPNPKGFLGGAQAGYNWQTGSLVLGVEADIQGANINGSAFQSPIIQNNGTPRAGSSLSASEKLNWLGTLRGRLGFTPSNPLLLYVTGGLAYGGVGYTANSDFVPPGTQMYPAAFSDTRVGWVVGGGLEWAFSPNWSAKIEGLWYDLGRPSDIANGVPGLPAGTCGNAPAFCQVGNSWKTQGAIARVGVNYRFGGPVLANY
jgi:outer membrane immunogenic protein